MPFLLGAGISDAVYSELRKVEIMASDKTVKYAAAFCITHLLLTALLSQPEKQCLDGS